MIIMLPHLLPINSTTPEKKDWGPTKLLSFVSSQKILTSNSSSYSKSMKRSQEKYSFKQVYLTVCTICTRRFEINSKRILIVPVTTIVEEEMSGDLKKAIKTVGKEPSHKIIQFHGVFVPFQIVEIILLFIQSNQLRTCQRYSLSRCDPP